MTQRQGSPALVFGLMESIWSFQSYLGTRITSCQCSRYPGRLPTPREDVREICAEQRSRHHHRGCLQGFATARVHSHGKGAVGDGSTVANWESCAARPFWPSLTIGGSYAM